MESVFPMNLENVEYSVIDKSDSAEIHAGKTNGANSETALFDDFPDIMTVQQISDALHIGRNSAYNLINSKAIGHLRIGSSIRVPKACLIDYVASTWHKADKQIITGCSDCQKGDRNDWQPTSQK